MLNCIVVIYRKSGGKLFVIHSKSLIGNTHVHKWLSIHQLKTDPELSRFILIMCNKQCFCYLNPDSPVLSLKPVSNDFRFF